MNGGALHPFLGANNLPLTSLSVDESSGVARFSAPDGEYQLAVCDLLGNRTSGRFWVRAPAE